MRKENTFKANSLDLGAKESRGVGAVMGMAIADALGACTEFKPWNKAGLGIIKDSFYDIHQAVLAGRLCSRSGKIGIWTDDASMGLSMGDSILLTDYHFHPQHIRYMFHMWLEHGLGNGGRPYSIGLGGNISISTY
jgi:ADP-ribosylglycohydrolase